MPAPDADRSPARLIVIGGSAGCFEPIGELVRALPRACAAAVLVVVHTRETAGTALHRVFGRGAAVPVSPAADGAWIERGHVYVSVAAHHLTVQDGRMRVLTGPRENGHRPAIDPLFRSAAVEWGSRVIGVILSGALDDGSEGLRAVVEHGGMGLVQDPDEAFMRDMPRHALRSAPRARATPVAEIARTLREVACRAPVPALASTPTVPRSDDGGRSMPVSDAEGPNRYAVGAAGTDPPNPAASGYICPDCGGSLFELAAEDPLKFRCRIGHAWTSEALDVEHQQELEQAVSVALRIIEDDLALQERLAERARRGHPHAVERLEQRTANRRATRVVLLEALERLESWR